MSIRKRVVSQSPGQIMMPSVLGTFLFSVDFFGRERWICFLFLNCVFSQSVSQHSDSGIGVQFWLVNTTMPPSVTEMVRGN